MPKLTTFLKSHIQQTFSTSNRIYYHFFGFSGLASVFEKAYISCHFIWCCDPYLLTVCTATRLSFAFCRTI